MSSGLCVLQPPGVVGASSPTNCVTLGSSLKKICPAHFFITRKMAWIKTLSDMKYYDL